MLNRKVLTFDKIKDALFFLMCFSLPFTLIPKPIQMNFLGGGVGSKLIFYPLFIGLVLSLWRQYKYHDVFVEWSKFKKIILIYTVIIFISLLHGLYIYPYYDLVLNGPISQIEKLPRVIELLSGFGISIDSKVLVAFWMIARVLKGFVLEIIYTFGCSYMIFCWYSKDWERCFRVFLKAVYVSLIVVLAYGCIDVETVSYVEYDLSYDRFSFDVFLDNFIENIKPVIVKYNTMMFDVYRTLLITVLKNNDVQLRLPIIAEPREEGLLINKHILYCTVNPGGAPIGHSQNYRRWRPESFAQVIDFIVKEYGLTVCLCGDKNDIPINQIVEANVKNKDKLVNTTGKTSFNEWIELTRHAEFVLGNDSSYIHLAAAVRTKAFVIAGYWAYGRFLPYKIDVAEKDGKLPILINIERPPCTFCSMGSIIKNSPEAKKAKQLCDDCVARTGVYKCINEISVERAIDVIRKNYSSK